MFIQKHLHIDKVTEGDVQVNMFPLDLIEDNTDDDPGYISFEDIGRLYAQYADYKNCDLVKWVRQGLKEGILEKNPDTLDGPDVKFVGFKD